MREIFRLMTAGALLVLPNVSGEYLATLPETVRIPGPRIIDARRPRDPFAPKKVLPGIPHTKVRFT